MNQNILFFLIAFLCVVVILSQVVDGGGKFITKSLVALMPSAAEGGWF